MSQELVGFQGMTYTSSQGLFYPERTLEFVHRINEQYITEEPMEAEYYATVSSEVAHKCKIVANKLGFHNLPIAPGLDADSIDKWLENYPKASIRRFHVEFCADLGDKFRKVFRGEGNKTVVSPKVLLARAALESMIGFAARSNAIRLAKRYGTGVNIHGDPYEDLVKSGKLDQLDGVKFVLIENGLINRQSRILGKGNISDIRVLARIADQQEGLDGVLFGADHYMDKLDQARRSGECGWEFNPFVALEDERVRANLRAIHISGAHHSPTNSEENRFIMERFIEQLAHTPHPHPVDLTLDGNPMLVLKSPKEEIFEAFRDEVVTLQNWLDKALKRAA